MEPFPILQTVKGFLKTDKECITWMMRLKSIPPSQEGLPEQKPDSTYCYFRRTCCPSHQDGHCAVLISSPGYKRWVSRLCTCAVTTCLPLPFHCLDLPEACGLSSRGHSFWFRSLSRQLVPNFV